MRMLSMDNTKMANKPAYKFRAKLKPAHQPTQQLTAAGLMMGVRHWATLECQTNLLTNSGQNLTQPQCPKQQLPATGMMMGVPSLCHTGMSGEPDSEEATAGA